MDQPPTRKLSIIVTGDVFYERFLWSDPDQRTRNNPPYTGPDELRTSRSTATVADLSGAPLHADIAKAFLDAWRSKRLELQLPTIPFDVTWTPPSSHPRILGPGNSYGDLDVFLHELGPFPESTHGKRDGTPFVWRIRRSFGKLVTPPSSDSSLLPSLEPLAHALLDRPDPTIVIINDRDLGFRERFFECIKAIDTRPTALSNLLILWHVREPITRGNMIADLLSHPPYSDVTIPILNHNCLRDEGLALRFDMSYESTLRKLLGSLESRLFQRLLVFPHILIRFDYGIVHLTTRRHALTGLDVHGLNTNPFHYSVERHGVVTGRTPLLVASIVMEVAEYLSQNDSTISQFIDRYRQVEAPSLTHNSPLDVAVDASLLLAASHFRRGYGRYSPYEILRLDEGTLPVFASLAHDHWQRRIRQDDPTHLKYRHALIADDRLTRLSVSQPLLLQSPSVATARDSYTRVELLANNLALEGYPIGRAYREQPDCALAPFDMALRKIVEYGLERVLTRDDAGTSSDVPVTEPSLFCPFVSFGNYNTINAKEIDGFLSLRHLVDKYVQQKDWTRPLAVAVFGAPGSGKSYIVSEILKSVSLVSVDKTLNCNLSQLNSVSALARYFHKVQDHALRGDMPIIFVDEFDSTFQGRTAGWLRYFLMPLQDGMYVDGEDVYHVGRSIFFFAGGISHTFDAFCKNLGSLDSEKVPDFISRLRGFVNVDDIDVGVRSCSETRGDSEQSLFSTRANQVRRAVILRSLLLSKVPQIVDPSSKEARINGSIVDAFANVPRFIHGVRSMEAIIEMSRVPFSPSSSFQPSALPPTPQLAMHVDIEAFLQYFDGGIG